MNPPTPETKRFRCVTFGCRVNQYETQAIREQLQAAGLAEAEESTPADFIVVNSCTVTGEADRECLHTLRTLHKENPQARILVTGCLVQRDAEQLKDLPGVAVLAGTGQKHRIAEFLRDMEAPHPSPSPRWGEGRGEGENFSSPRVELELSRVYAPLAISRFDGMHKAFVKVQDGCDRACAFCKIPLVRGRSRSRPLADVLEEFRRLIDSGLREITLAGVAIGLWGAEWSPRSNLAELVEAVDRLPGRFRVRISSLDPRDLDEPLIGALAGSTKICRHLHLSLQSGSDPVLDRMNRGYTTGEFAGRVAHLRRSWPDMGVTTDLIAGFPGETEENFQETLKFCRDMRFAKVHVFPYSRRRGTTASLIQGHLPSGVVRERARLLRQAAEETAGAFQKRFLGTRQEVLVERTGEGYTGQFVRVRLEGGAGRAGELLPVEITAEEKGRLAGKIFRGDLDKLTHRMPPLTWKYNLE